ncbi:hypothetical protein LTR86_009953 [Recurvomyces mirabilis]|nr:hypothetical protein LTR86_009953 [Recurvomyces mirabilis]
MRKKVSDRQVCLATSIKSAYCSRGFSLASRLPNANEKRLSWKEVGNEIAKFMSKPSLVLVHGSWHCPQHFELVTPILEGHGYHTVPVSLPSTQSHDSPPKDLADDTAAVRSAVLSELDHEKDVVVIAHSYGGCVANNALSNLDAKSRASEGKTTKVLAIIFLCAFPIPAGTTFAQAAGIGPDRSHPMLEYKYSPDFADVAAPGPGYWFYHDLPPAQAEKYTALLKSQACRPWEQKTGYAAYLDLPAWYLLCAQDQAFNVKGQEVVVESLRREGAVVRTGRVEAGHSPFLSRPVETAGFIVGAAEDASRG